MLETMNYIINFVPNFDQNGFPKALNKSEICWSVAAATAQQLQRPGALLERCSAQEAPVAALRASFEPFLIATWSDLLHS